MAEINTHQSILKTVTFIMILHLRRGKGRAEGTVCAKALGWEGANDVEKQIPAEGQHEGGGMIWVEKLQRLGNTEGLAAMLRIQHYEKLRQAFHQRRTCSDLHFERSQSVHGTEGAVVEAWR